MRLVVFLLGLMPLTLWAACPTPVPADAICVRMTLPTENVDGTVIDDGAGTKIYWGASSGNYTNTFDDPNWAGNGATIENLITTGQGTWFIAATAYDTAGNESAYSNEVEKAPSGSTVEIPGGGIITGELTFTPAGPVGTFIQKDVFNTTGQNFNASFPNATTAGNLLVAILAHGHHNSGVQTPPSGFQELYSNVGQGLGGLSASAWYKVANGTETTVSVTMAGGSSAESSLLILEYQWDGAPPVVQMLRDETNLSTGSSDVAMGPLTPNNLTRNLVLSWISVDVNTNFFDGKSWTPSGGFIDADIQNNTQADSEVIRWVNYPGEISTGFTSSDAGDQNLGVLVIFN